MIFVEFIKIKQNNGKKTLYTCSNDDIFAIIKVIDKKTKKDKTIKMMIEILNRMSDEFLNEDYLFIKFNCFRMNGKNKIINVDLITSN